MMTNADPTPAKALSLALSRLDQPLSQPLQAAIHHLSTTLRNNSPAINDEIRQIVAQDARLSHLYQDAYDELEAQYQSQERSKSFDLLFPRETDWWNRFIQIVSANDSVFAARQTFQGIESQRRSRSKEDFWEKGDRIVVMAAGGAFLGGAIAHLLTGNQFTAIGAILGALLAALYGWYIGFGKINSNS